ncbi:MAG: hypothetical protein WCW26_03600, partial [Candidatus Buchananbacteria bacterium]
MNGNDPNTQDAGPPAEKKEGDDSLGGPLPTLADFEEGSDGGKQDDGLPALPPREEGDDPSLDAFAADSEPPAAPSTTVLVTDDDDDELLEGLLRAVGSQAPEV